MSFYDQEMIGGHHSLPSETSHRSTRRRLSSNAEIEDAQQALMIDSNKRGRTPRVSSRPNATGKSRVSAVTLTQVQSERMHRQEEMLSQIQTRQEHLEQNAGQLITSITQMMEQLALEQSRHKKEMIMQEEAVVETRHQNKIMTEVQSQQTEHIRAQQQALVNHRQVSRCLAGQLQRCFQEQGSKLSSTSTETEVLRQSLADMRRGNRNRSAERPSSSGEQYQTRVTQDTESHRPKNQHIPEDMHGAPDYNHPKMPMENEPMTPPTGSTIPFMATPPGVQPTTTNSADPPAPSIAPTTGNTVFTVPNAMIDACPAFMPQSYQQWRREVKLWVAAQAGATIAQLLAKMISCLPMSVRMGAMTYMEETESHPRKREMKPILDLSDTRFGKTDTGKSWMWLSQFTEFKRNSSGNFKDFWSRYSRTITKLQSLGMTVNEEMVFRKVIQALRLPDGQLPIVLSAFRTMNASTSAQSLKELKIKMYETHRPITAHTDVYQAQIDLTGGDDSVSASDTGMTGESEEIEIADSDGQVFLMKPKEKSKPKNSPGAAESARHGAIRTFQGAPAYKGIGKGAGKSFSKTGPCLRRDGPNRWHRDCPLPFKEVLDSQTARTWKGKGKGKSSARTMLVADGEENPQDAVEECAVTSDECTGGESGDRVDPPAEGSDGTTIAPGAGADEWWSEYFQNCPTYVIQVCQPVTVYKNSQLGINGHSLSEKSPLILIDSGASLSVAGKRWLQWRSRGKDKLSAVDGVTFRFGDGPNLRSLGKCTIDITLLPHVTNQSAEQILKMEIHVVDSDVPLSMSRKSLARMGASIDFRQSRLNVDGGITVQLEQTPSGHLMLPGTRREESTPISHPNVIGGAIYAASLDVSASELSLDQLKKIRNQLGHCSEATLTSLLRAAHIVVPVDKITQLFRDCNCQAGVHRVTPPNVSCWIAKYNGEVVAVDICYPFTDAHKEITNGGKFPALIMVDILSRYVNCSLIPKVTGGHVTAAFLNDWVRPLGKPRRVLMDQGGPGFRSGERTQASDTFGWQLVAAPVRTQSQNGLAERNVRSIKTAIRNLLAAESYPKPEQRIITMAAIAENHAPHSLTGLPPALAMLGRCDVLAGLAQTAFNHNPDSTDPTMRQMNTLRNIMNARNAIIHAEANRVVRICTSRPLADRGKEFFPIDSTVQIAHDKRWRGSFRVVAHMHSNLILEQGGRLSKWPKYKTRLLYESPEEDFDNVLAPKKPGKQSRAAKARGGSDPPGWAGARPPVASSDEESSDLPKIDWDKAGQTIKDIEREIDELLAGDEEQGRMEREGRQFLSDVNAFDAYYHSLPTGSYSAGRPLLCSDSTNHHEYA